MGIILRKAIDIFGALCYNIIQSTTHPKAAAFKKGSEKILQTLFAGGKSSTACRPLLIINY